MAPTAPEFLVVGHVSRPHGIRGEVLVLALTDHPEGTFAPGVVLLQGDGEGERPDPDAPPLRIEATRAVSRGFLVRFGGTRDRDDAERLRGRYLLRPTSEVPPLGEDELFYHQLLGLSVETTDGTEVGRVREVYEMRPYDLLEVVGRRGSVLIPFNRAVVVEVEPEAGRLVVDPPEGLLDL